MDQLRQIEEHNLSMFVPESRKNRQGTSTKPRKIQIQKAGDYYRARYAGRPTAVFVWNPDNAAKQLKFFDSEVNHV